MGGVAGRQSNHLEGRTMTRIVINFTDPETKLLDRVATKTGLSYHGMIMRAGRAYDHKRS